MRRALSEVEDTMFSRDPSRPFDARLEGRGFDAAGPAGGTHQPVDGNSTTERTVDDSSASERLPGGVEGDAKAERRPRENDSRKPDGLDDLKRMEENAEAGRE